MSEIIDIKRYISKNELIWLKNMTRLALEKLIMIYKRIYLIKFDFFL